MSYQSIGSALKTIVQGVSGFASVYDEAPTEMVPHPYALIIPTGHQSNFGSTQRNLREYNFQITLYHSQDIAGYEAKLRQLADAVLDAVEANTSLNSTCEYNRVTSGSWGWVETQKPMRTVVFNVTAFKRAIVR